MRLSPFMLVAVSFFALCGSVRANTDPPTWLDVTNYGADPSCTSDSGSAINSTISAASAPGQVIFFPKGCYLINTQIVDTNSTPGLTYLGFGRVELSAGSSLSGSIIKLGNDSTTITRRRLDDLYFECNSRSGIDGIDLDGLTNSEFVNIEIRDCANFGLRTVGSNNNNYQDVFEGGGIAAEDAGAFGISLTYATNDWVFKGVKVGNSTSGTPTGIGIEFEGAGDSCFGCQVSGWNIGIAIAPSGYNGGAYATEISGGYFENNRQYQIQAGYYGSQSDKVYGLTIHGAYFSATNSTSPSVCIDLEQVDSYHVFGNEFNSCKSDNIWAHADVSTSGDYEGADNGVIGPNHSDGSAPDLYSSYGSNITYIAGGQIKQLNSKSVCNSSASPAVCGSDANGSIVLAAGSSTVTVDTTAVTTNSQILLTFDSSLGSRLGVTCNSTYAAPFVSSRSAGTSFTISVNTAPSTNPACYSYSILN